MNQKGLARIFIGVVLVVVAASAYLQQNSQVFAQLAPIAIDTASSGFAQSSNLSWPHTVGAGTDRFLLVGVSIRDLDPPDSVSTITYAGQSLTKIGRKSFNRDASVEMWYLKNPPTGTGSVVVTLTGIAGIVGGGNQLG
jgi:hypothetical protein